MMEVMMLGTHSGQQHPEESKVRMSNSISIPESLEHLELKESCNAKRLKQINISEFQENWG